MSRKNLILVAIAAVLVLVGAGAAWYFLRPASDQTAGTEATTATSALATATGKPGELPDPTIAVLDRIAILQFSKVGQDIMRQMQGFTKQASTRIQGQRNALQNDIQAFQQQEATMAADAREKRANALQQREQSLAAATAREENTLKAAMAAAHDEVSKQVGPILQQIAQQRRVNMVMDKAAVPIVGGAEFDITPDVIAALDAKMSSYAVSLTPAAPAGAGVAP